MADMSIDESNDMTESGLQRYVALAKELGATEATLVRASAIPIEERIRMKCLVPRCPTYGKCANCPPHVPEIGKILTALRSYHWGLLVRLEERQERFPEAPTAAQIEAARAEAFQRHARLNAIIAKLESAAFRDGYYLAMGLGAGSCVDTLCEGASCAVLAGNDCRHPFKARPSMEALGIDVFGLAKIAGHPLQPIGYTGDDADASQVATALGLVMIE